MGLAYTLLNWVIDAIQSFGLRIPPLDSDGLIAAARRKANLQDLGETFPWEGPAGGPRNRSKQRSACFCQGGPARNLINALVLRLRLEQARQGPAARNAPDPPAADCLWPPTQWDDLSPPPAGESRRRATAALVGAPRTHSWPWSRSAAGDGRTRPRSSPSVGPGLNGRPDWSGLAAGRMRSYSMRAALAGPTFYTGPQGARYLELSFERDMLPVYRDWRAMLSLLDVPGNVSSSRTPTIQRTCPALTVLPTLWWSGPIGTP